MKAGEVFDKTFIYLFTNFVATYNERLRKLVKDALHKG